ncbi:Peroxiredoxin Q, chloroplastic [Apostasia shenzhenica]|uniref:thioredoxin-dependent peroxiredoxin n=1 Tax=Apostasia shenzhenica TaxID=1088818 RepID=A0A2I0B071_9ASPA|nr:Peroxiredoxin Q, chloroplastic [Apostasia shenzhenica]
MACSSLVKSPPPFLQAIKTKKPNYAPHSHLFLLKSSRSQIFGFKLHSPDFSSPTFLSASSPICAKILHLSSDLKPEKGICWLECMKVSTGDAPPSFNLKDQDWKNVSLSKYKGKPVVVYFYPADESPGCTKEACAFRDSYDKFKKAGAEVVGISADDPNSHKAFAKKYRLPFILLSDEGNKVRKAWGVPSDLFGTLPGRQTYVIDKKGVVRLVYNNQFQPEKHVDETLKLLQSL